MIESSPRDVPAPSPLRVSALPTPKRNPPAPASTRRSRGQFLLTRFECEKESGAWRVIARGRVDAVPGNVVRISRYLLVALFRSWWALRNFAARQAKGNA